MARRRIGKRPGHWLTVLLSAPLKPPTSQVELADTSNFEPGELVRRILAGDRTAEAEMVQQYSRGVFFLISQMVSHKASAEDIYQETFQLTLEKIRTGQLREPEKLSNFICGIARNLVIEQFRRDKKRRAREESDFEQPIARPEPSPLDRLLRDEQRVLMRRVLDALPSDRDRKVLYRFYLEDEDKEKICAELAVSSLHFNQILCRARERYRKLLQETIGREEKL